MTMLVSDFSYALPDELIARYPVEQRDASRLMVLQRSTGQTSETIFSTLPEYLHSGDVLVLNDTRVIPARLFGTKESGGRVEIFLVQRCAGSEERWMCLVRASKRFRCGQTVRLANGMNATLESKSCDERWIVVFSGDEQFSVWLEREGHMPLPPYLQRLDEGADRERYQTVFACNPGAVAAPTAGLHLTHALLDMIASKGVEIVSLTLHTGLGTFLPVRVENVEDHKIHVERYVISPAAASAINRAKKCGNRVISVGTTTARTLEYASDIDGHVRAGEGEADIFIYPGYTFKVVDALLTNFHLPESTLLMLVSAFAGRERVLRAYQRAIESRFRFFSYGDAMLLE